MIQWGGIATLLWTNPSPTNTYAGGSITTLNMSVFDEIKITYRTSTTDSTEHIIKVDNVTLSASSPYGGYAFCCTDFTDNEMYGRTIGKSSETNLTIGGAYILARSGGNHTKCIPLKIEGIIY